MAKKGAAATRKSGSSSSSSSSSDIDDRTEMLRLLEQQCRQALGEIEQDEDEPSAESTVDEQSDDEDNDDDDEWTGIDAVVDDDDGGIQAAFTKDPVTIVFSEASSSRRTLDDGFSDGRSSKRDSFMSSKIRSHIKLDEADAKGKRRQSYNYKETAEEAIEEKHLSQLDATLADLIRDLPPSGNQDGSAASSKAMTAALLPKLAAAALPDPRLTFKKDREGGGAKIDKRAPRQLREALYTARLERAKARASSQAEAGIVSHRQDLAAGDFAITKKQRRLQTGDEDRRRKNARGLAGVVGRMSRGGSMLKLSRDEIAKTGLGDADQLQRRKGSNHNKRSGTGPHANSRIGSSKKEKR